LHTSGKSYLVRLSNIEKYAPHYLAAGSAGLEHIAAAPTGALVSKELEPVETRPLRLLPTSLPPPGKAVGIWLHPDDLAPEIGPLAGLQPVSIATCLSHRVYRDTFQLSQQRIAALQAVLGDGVSRAAAHFGCPALELESDDPVEALHAWALQHRLSEVIALSPTVGPVHDLVGRLENRLEKAGTRLTLVRRPSDATAFSFASGGFFPFWQKMRAHLTETYPS
jgi:hypothetical protein